MGDTPSEISFEIPIAGAQFREALDVESALPSPSGKASA
jgi:hypothetical protein